MSTAISVAVKLSFGSTAALSQLETKQIGFDAELISSDSEITPGNHRVDPDTKKNRRNGFCHPRTPKSSKFMKSPKCTW